MSGFRDSFTKDETKGSNLLYDDSAFMYFAGAAIATVAAPWTYFVLKNLLFPESRVHEEGLFPLKSSKGSKLKYCQTSGMIARVDEAKAESKKFSRRFSPGFFLRIAILTCLWSLVYFAINHLAGEDAEIKSFDPFQILGISYGADDGEIKRAYRKKSLLYHPDKNPNDPLANSNFIQVTKAYNALTDEVAKKNYEKYGNPDGPTTMKVGIGLPRFLLANENQVLILCSFFLVLLFVVPVVFLGYYQRQKMYAPNGVMVETLSFLSYYMTDGTRVKNGPEMIACSAESRLMKVRPSDNKDMIPVADAVEEGAKPRFNKHGTVMRNRLLIWAHLQRLHNLLTPNLRDDLNSLLRISVRITQAMVELALMREWVVTAMSMVELIRCIVQAIDPSASTLLQIPHFTEQTVAHCSKGKGGVNNIRDFLALPADQRKGLADMTPQQIADIDEFARHVGRAKVTAKIEVEDEPDIAEGDVATITVEVARSNLAEGEAEGPVHAPLYPQAKFEEFWILLMNTANNRLITFARLRSTERVASEKIRFMLGAPGKHLLQLHVMSDSYAGFDEKIDITFDAKKKEDVARDVFVHPGDAELDKLPTLFEQMMGSTKDLDYESSDEEGESPNSEGKAAKKQAPAKKSSPAPKGGLMLEEEDGDGSSDDDSDHHGHEH